MLISAVEQSDSVMHMCVCVCVYIYIYIYIYIFFFLFFSIMAYHSILNTVPCAMQYDLVVYPAVHPELPILPFPPLSLVATASLFSMSVSLFLFICVIF